VTSDEQPPEPPTWLALHEFETEDVDVAALKKLTDTEWTKKIHDHVKVAVHPVYKIAKVHGKGEWFHGREV
jgi:hypothetical protein